MADASINGYPVIEARVTRPRVGLWIAEVVVDVSTAEQLQAGTRATLLTDGESLSFQGTVFRSDAYAQGVTLRMIAGSGKMSTNVKPRFYAGATVAQPVSDALSDAGEVLATSSIPAALATPLTFWSMLQQPASDALSSLADAAGGGCVWRALADGSIYFGADGYPPSALTTFELIAYMPMEKLQVIASESPTVNPGENFNGFDVSVVQHKIDANGSRVTIWYE